MQSFISPDGTRLAYRDEGAGPALLCLAGLTRNSSDFDFLAPHLHGIRMIRMDYRGRGASDWADPRTYTINQESQDALALLDHLDIERAAILGTSRGGLIAMTLAAVAKDRLTGVCLNDIGPEIAPEGIAAINAYLGRPPPYKTFEQAAADRANMPGFANVPAQRWHDEVRHLFKQTADGLELNYDPRLREAFEGAGTQPLPDLWPLFKALEGLPLALIRGKNSNILTVATATRMRRRRRDMEFADVPDRGHVPFLDEPESLAVIHRWLEHLK